MIQRKDKDWTLADTEKVTCDQTLINTEKGQGLDTEKNRERTLNNTDKGLGTGH